MPSPTHIAPEAVGSEGGHEIIIFGTFTAGHAHQVHVGRTETTADPLAWSGKPGSPHTVYPLGGVLRCYTPQIDAGAPDCSILVVDLNLATDNVLSAVLAVYPRQYLDRVFVLRHQLPTKYKTGPRHIGAVR